MIPNKRYFSIAASLLTKTREGKIKWVLDPGSQGSKQDRWQPDNYRPRNNYFFQLPNSKVELRFESPSTEVDRIILAFRNPTGLEVGRWTAEEGLDEWTLASELYEEVDRQVSGWDKVLKDVETFLANDSR
jgi:hypothetical protein